MQAVSTHTLLRHVALGWLHSLCKPAASDTALCRSFCLNPHAAEGVRQETSRLEGALGVRAMKSALMAAHLYRHWMSERRDLMTSDAISKRQKERDHCAAEIHDQTHWTVRSPATRLPPSISLTQSPAAKHPCQSRGSAHRASTVLPARIVSVSRKRAWKSC